MTTTTKSPRELMADVMTEAQLQAQVLGIAQAYGWRAYHTHDSRRSPSGFPDLTLVHAKAGRLLFVELKRQNGRYRPGQREWLDDLNQVCLGIRHDLYEFASDTAVDQAGINHRILAVTWRPSDLLNDTVETMLKESR